MAAIPQNIPSCGIFLKGLFVRLCLFPAMNLFGQALPFLDWLDSANKIYLKAFCWLKSANQLLPRQQAKQHGKFLFFSTSCFIIIFIRF
jgi:hypothetical protein